MSPQITQDQINDVNSFLELDEEEKKRRGLLPGRPPSLPEAPKPKLTKPLAPEPPEDLDPGSYVSDVNAFLQSETGGGPGFEKPLAPTMRPEGPRVRPYSPEDPESDVEMFMNTQDLESKGYKPVSVKGETFAERAKSFQQGQSKATKKRMGQDDVGTMKHMASSFMLGASNMIAAMPEYVAIAAKEFEDATGLFVRDEAAEDRLLYKLGQSIRKAAIEWFPQSEELADSFLYTTLPQGAGSLATFMALGVAGKVAKLPAWVIPMVAGATSTSANMYLEAKEFGATDDEAFGAWLGGHLAGGLEAVPVGRALSRFDQFSGGGVKKILANGFIGGVEELTQELAQTMTENYVTQLTFDEQRQIMDGTFEAAGAGGILGALASLMIGAAGMRMRGRAATGRPTEEDYEDMDPESRAIVKAEFDKLDAMEKRFDEDFKSGKWSKEEMEEAKTKLQKFHEDQMQLSPGEQAGGVTVQMKKDASAEKVSARAEHLADSGKKKPEARDKTEDDEIEVIEGKRKEKDGLTQETMPSIEESEKAIKEDIEKNEGITQDPDIDRLRQLGAGSRTDAEVAAEEEVAVAPEEVAVAPEEAPVEAPVEAAPEVTEEPDLPPDDYVEEVIPEEAEEPVSEEALAILTKFEQVGSRNAPSISPGERRRLVELGFADQVADQASGTATVLNDRGREVINQIRLDKVAPETSKERRTRVAEEKQISKDLEESRTKKIKEDNKFVKQLKEEGEDYSMSHSGSNNNYAFWPVSKNGKNVAMLVGGKGVWEVYEVGDAKKKIVDAEFGSRKEAFNAAVMALHKPSTEVESEEKIEARETATRERLKSEKDKLRTKNFYIIARDGQVYSMKRKLYREWLEIGAAGKDNSDMTKVSSSVKPIQKWAKHLAAMPEGVTAKDHLEQAIGSPALSLEEATSDTFKEELSLLDIEEKEAGIYVDPIPEGVDPAAHARAYKYYDVGTVEYELALDGGIEFPRNAKGKLTQEGKDMLLHNPGAKTDARQYNYGDPIYVDVSGSCPASNPKRLNHTVHEVPSDCFLLLSLQYRPSHYLIRLSHVSDLS